MDYLKKTLLLAVFLQLSFFANAQIPSGYYDPAQGLTGELLKNSLHNIIDGHNAQSYTSLWTHFQSTDQKSDGTVWDMYSNCSFTFINDQCGNYSSECDCYNREHSFPKSWFSDAMPMYSDLFHLVPTDGYVNGQRGNLPYGEVGTATYTSSNGSKKGNCIYPGYSGTVFEPIDEYKGDFARGYLYMAVRYKDEIGSWSSEMLNGVDGYEEWALNLLLDWHEQDPVSMKEIDRNDAIYDIQNNRNPFIDHPEYANQIWVGGTITSPSITDITITPSSPLPTETVSVSANVTDDGTITSVELNWGLISGNLTNGPISMSSSKGVYTTDSNLPAQTEGTTVYFQIEATDNEGNMSTSAEQNYTVGGIVTGGGMEDFSNYANTQGSYINGTFLGQDGSTWNYLQCRGDVLITNETPCLGKDKTPTAAVYSGTISGGIGSMSFDYMQAFSTNVELNVLINDIVVETITTSNEPDVIKNSGSIPINVEGNFVMKFEQASTAGGQVSIDNISWSGFATACQDDSVFHYESICQGENFMGYYEEGVHYHVVPKPDGCDSVYEINLTVNDTSRIVEQEAICTGDSLLWQGSYYKEQGIYEVLYSSVHGCDSVYELNLSLNPIYSFEDDESICEGDSILWQENYYNEEGVYSTEYQTIEGCDSIYYLNLSINPAYNFEESETICEGDSILWQGNYYNEEGVYPAEYQTIEGCDSMYYLNIILNPTYLFEEFANICEGENYQWHGNIYNAEGQYFDSLLTANNCDSVFCLNLTVNENPEIYLGEDSQIFDTAILVLDAGEGFSEYLWNDLYSGQTFTVDSTFGLGDHEIWVMVTDENNCNGFDTVLVTIVHYDYIDLMEKISKFNIYPNPVYDELIVQSLENERFNVEIIDLKSRLILQKNGNIGKIELLLKELPKGMYLLKISNNSETLNYKIIKK